MNLKAAKVWLWRWLLIVFPHFDVFYYCNESVGGFDASEKDIAMDIRFQTETVGGRDFVVRIRLINFFISLLPTKG